MKKLIIFIFSLMLLGSCVTVSRYSGEIYPANVTFERPNFKYIKTITGSSDATFSRISITSDFFTRYELEIEKQRYFSSVTYYNSDDSERLEIGEAATGLYLTCSHYDNLNNKYTFSGERN